MPRELPAFRDHIRSRRAALAGFMEQGAALAIEGDVLTVFPRNDIYVRYLADNRAVLAELASENFDRPIKVELARPGTPAPEAEPSEAGAASSGPPQGNGQPRIAAAGSAASSADERAEIYSDPGMRRIFDAFEARLVEVRASRGGREQDS